MHEVVQQFHTFFTKTFGAFGPTPAGVDWGDDRDAAIRHAKMLEVVQDTTQRVSLLDLGCGYGAFYEYIDRLELDIEYTGIDMVSEMVQFASGKWPNATFIHGDVLETDFGRTFDYVVCNGVLTAKFSASTEAMNSYYERITDRMWQLCDNGMAFNVMSSSRVRNSNALFVCDPTTVLARSIERFSSWVRLDQNYALSEFTTFVYRPGELLTSDKAQIEWRNRPNYWERPEDRPL